MPVSYSLTSTRINAGGESRTSREPRNLPETYEAARHPWAVPEMASCLRLMKYSDRMLAFDLPRRIRVSRVKDQRRIEIPQFRKSINPSEIVFPSPSCLVCRATD
jgi:hypothetical protein